MTIPATIRSAAWPVAILILATVVNLVSWSQNRLYVSVASDVLALALPVLLLAQYWPAIRAGMMDRGATWAVALCTTLIAWIGLVNVVRQVPQQGWNGWFDLLLTLACALTVALSGAPAGTLLRILGLGGGVALAAVVATDAHGVFTPHNTANALFGNLVWVVHVAGPAILAWVTYEAVRYRDRAGAWPWAFGAGACLVLLALITVLNGRRGTLLGGGAVVGWTVLALLLERWPRLRRAIIVLATVGGLLLVAAWTHRAYQADLAGGGGGHAAASDAPRLRFARATLETMRATFPWGDGGGAPTRIKDTAPDQGAYITTSMGMVNHVHNDFLEMAIEGGLAGFLLLGALTVLLVRRTAAVDDRPLRLGAQALGLALLVNALTNNGYATSLGHAWVGAVIGLLLRLPATPAAPAPPAALHAIRWSLPVLAILCALSAWRLLPLARLPGRQAPPEQILAAIPGSHDPYQTAMLGRIGLLEATVRNDRCLGDAVVVAMDQALGRAPWGLEPFYWIYRTGTPGERIAAARRCADLYPFEDHAYQILHQAIATDPSQQLPDRLRLRIAAQYGPPSVRMPLDPAPPRTVDEAVDRYIALRCLIYHGGDGWPDVPQALSGLFQRYREIPNLTKIALELMAFAPSEQRDTLGGMISALPLLWPEPDNLADFWSQAIRSPQQARGLLPWLERWHGPAFAQAAKEQLGGDPLVEALRKIRGLARGPEGPLPPAGPSTSSPMLH